MIVEDGRVDVDGDNVLITDGLTVGSDGLKVADATNAGATATWTNSDTNLVISAVDTAGTTLRAGHTVVGDNIDAGTTIDTVSGADTGTFVMSQQQTNAKATATSIVGTFNTADKLVSGVLVNVANGLKVFSSFSAETLGASMTGGLSILTGALKVTGGISVLSGGSTITDGLTINSDGVVVTGGLTLQAGAEGTITISGGLRVRDTGLTVTGGIDMDDDFEGLVVTGGISVIAGGFRVTGSISVADSGMKVNGGLTVNTGGMYAKSKLTVHDSGITSGGVLDVTGAANIAGGLTINDSGLGVTGGIVVDNTGLSVSSSGVKVVDGGAGITGGLTVSLNGLKTEAGASEVLDDGVTIAGGITITGGAVLSQGVVVDTVGAFIGNGLTVSTGGAKVKGAVVVQTSGLTVVAGGLTVYTGGVSGADSTTVDAVGVTILNSGLSTDSAVFPTLLSTAGLSITASGMKITDGGATVEADGMKVTGGLTVNAVATVISQDGLAVTKGTFEVDGGLTIYDTGVVVANGGAAVDAVTKVLDDGVVVSSGGLHVSSSGVISDAAFHASGSLVATGLLSVSSNGLKTGTLAVTVEGMNAGGGVSVQTGGLHSKDVLSITTGGLKVLASGVQVTTGNAKIAGGSLDVTADGATIGGGITVYTNGIAVSRTGAASSVSDGATVAGGLVADDGLSIAGNLVVTDGNIDVSNGGFVGNSAKTSTAVFVHDDGVPKVKGGLTVNANGVKTTGITRVLYNGADITGGLTSDGTKLTLVAGTGKIIGGLDVALDGMTVSSNGVNVVDGGISMPSITYTSSAGKAIDTGTGLLIKTNPFKISSSGGAITGGITVSTSGLKITNGDLHVVGSGNHADKLTVDASLSALGGLNIAATGATVATGGFKITTGGAQVSGGLAVPGTVAVSGGNVVVTNKLSVESGGLTSSNGFTFSDNANNAALDGLTVAGGMTVNTGGLKVTGTVSVTSGSVTAGNVDTGASGMFLSGDLKVGNTGSSANMNVAYLRANQLVYNNGYSTSDLRLKENIQKVGPTADEISRINGFYFDWKDASKNEKRSVGFVAQEIEEVFPNLIEKGSDYDYLSVRYNEMAPVILEALKQIALEKDLKEISPARYDMLNRAVGDLRAKVEKLRISDSVIDTKDEFLSSNVGRFQTKEARLFAKMQLLEERFMSLRMQWKDASLEAKSEISSRLSGLSAACSLDAAIALECKLPWLQIALSVVRSPSTRAKLQEFSVACGWTTSFEGTNLTDTSGAECSLESYFKFRPRNHGESLMERWKSAPNDIKEDWQRRWISEGGRGSLGNLFEYTS